PAGLDLLERTRRRPPPRRGRRPQGRSLSAGRPPPRPAPPAPGHRPPRAAGHPAPGRGREIASLNYAIDLRSWMAAPDPEQVRLRDIALDSLRDRGGGQPALVAPAQGMLDGLGGQGR